ncbi:MAG: M56 family metallopeptidase [Ferruginibacter sp.]|nr:M56 family metallopeptidase [Ferruginibacter sp.]
MPLPIFDNAYFLQSVGWAIAHSFWQAGFLWLLYSVIVRSNGQLSALAKYQLGVCVLLSVFAWFIFTIVGNYQELANQGVEGFRLTPFSWTISMQSVNGTLPFLSLLYFSLLAIHCISFTRKLLSNHRIQENGLSKAPLDFRLFVNRTALHLGIKRPVKVCMSEFVDVPSVTGFFKPVILLPFALFNHLTMVQAEAILLHELAHIKRNDYLVNLVQNIIQLILFFNPFVVLLNKQISKERENCCDDWVMNFRFNKFEYASALLLLEEQRHQKLTFALAATNNKKNLLGRIKRLYATEPQTSQSLKQRFKISATFVIILFGILLALPTRLQQQNIQAPTEIAIEPISFPLNTAGPVGPELARTVRYVAPTLQSTEKIIAKAETRSRTKKSKPVPPVKAAKEQVYVNALINQDLLTPASEESATATLAAKIEGGLDSTTTYYINVEEQQSGEKGSQSYLFQLDDKAGATSIKPLIMLNKTKVAVPKQSKQPKAKASSHRKVRTTS